METSQLVADPNITSKGVVWNTAPNPTIALSTRTSDGSGTGAFSSNITGLQPSTLYYVRAYATNSVGTSYGEERQFTTLFVSVKDEILSGSFRLYPNPVTQNRLTASFSEKGSLTLFDARGRMVFQKSDILGTETLLVSLKSGFYFATIETAKGRQTVKVVVE